MEDWNQSAYGKLIRFCDSGTLDSVRAVWLTYLPEGPGEKEKAAHRVVVNARLKKARTFREKNTPGAIPSYTRSAAPLTLASLQDVGKHKAQFWDKQNIGSTPNPSLVLASADTSMLHYGTDSLLGFHLSTAYAPLVANYPHAPAAKNRDAHHHLVETAQLAFHAWCASFRDNHESMTLRFCASDALMFCYTMQNLNVSNETCANWPRSPYHPDILNFDHPDYANAEAAPRIFDVIDTSNLMDHLGALNLLPAVIPLVKRKISSTLYTELLAKRDKEIGDVLDDLLGGDFRTMTALLGLFPVGYWTNASATSDADERLLEKVYAKDSVGQMFLRKGWKLQLSRNGSSEIGTLEKISFLEDDLLCILLQCYQGLFSHENMGNMMRLAMAGSRDKMTEITLPRYQRPGFAAFLAFIRERVHSPAWDELLKALVRVIEGQSQLLVNMNFMQEFYIYNHFFGLDTVDTLIPKKLEAIRFRTGLSRGNNDFRSWPELPPVVNITVRVPRSKLNIFTRDDNPPVSPYLNGFVESSIGLWQNNFAAVKVCFGTATISGSRSKEDYAVAITPDASGWGGKADMFVSFWVPAWMLLEDSKPRVGLCLQSTPQIASTFVSSLGLQLKVFETCIGSESNAYVTKHGPNGCGFPVLRGTAMKKDQSANGNGRDGGPKYKTQFLAFMGSREGTISTLAARVELFDEELKSALDKPELIELKHDSPCSLSVQIKGKLTRYAIDFPAPIVGSKAAVDVYEEGCVTVPAPTSKRPEQKFPGYMFPIYIEQGTPVLWNIPFVRIDRLPVLDCEKPARLEWLNSHISCSFTARERSLRGSAALTNDARVNFKESLFTMYMYATGVQGEKRMRIFGLDHQGNGGVEILIFVAAVRLDPANRTVILDAAVLPLRDEIMSALTPLIHSLRGKLLRIKVDEAEKKLWKEVLPSYIERCRTWSHLPTCEYTRPNARVPLSTDMGKRMACSCGEGKLPPNFMDTTPQWNIASKYAVRAAISPPFPLALVEEVFPAGFDNPVAGADAADAQTRAKSDDECWNCGKEKCEDGKELRRCSGCSKARYCSRSCQRGDLKGHKVVCKK